MLSGLGFEDAVRVPVIFPDPSAFSRGELVREQLESAFQLCGVSEGMLMDHRIPWWNPSGASHLALWLMKQGIGMHWSRIRHP